MRKRVIAIIVSGAVAFLIAGLNNVYLCAEGGCANIVLEQPTQDLFPFLSYNGQNCPDESYVKHFTAYAIDGYAYAYGQCGVTGYDPPSQMCVIVNTLDHLVTGISYVEVGTPSPGHFAPNPSPPYPHAMDTRVNGTTYPRT